MQGWSKNSKSCTTWLALLTFTLTSFISTPNVHAESAVLSTEVFPQFSSLKLPPDLAKVETFNVGESNAGRSVIVIQDAHSIPDAQRSIRKIILYLEKNYGVKQIGVEGASGDLDTRIFQSFPDQARLQTVFKDYMDKGEMTGSVAAAIFGLKKEMSTKGVDFFGVEDWSVYEEGLALYLKAMQGEGKIVKQLEVRSSKLDEEKKAAYSPELLALDQAQVEFEENSKDLLAYLKTLAGIQAPKAGSEIALLLDEADKGQAEEAALGTEVRAIAAKLKARLGRLSQAGQKNFHENLQAFQISQISASQFALALKDLSVQEDFKLPMSQGMAHQAFNQRRMRDLEGTSLFKDIEAYTNGIKEFLFRNNIERQLDQRTHELILLKKWARLELSREDWGEIKGKLEAGSWKLEEKRKEVSGNAKTNREITGMAEEHAADKRNLSNNEKVSERGAVWSHESDSQGGSVHSVQYRRGERPAVQEGVSAVSASIQGISLRGSDSDQDRNRAGVFNARRGDDSSSSKQRGDSDAERTHSVDAVTLPTSNFQLLTSLKYNKAFYENAEKRDAAFIHNLEKRLRPGEPAIVIAGGFHAQGLAEHLQAKGIDYALVMPNISKLPEVSAYREHMKGNVDWKSYFEVKNGKINLYDAFVRYTRDRLLKLEVGSGKLEEGNAISSNFKLRTSNPMLLKNWRDQIIRDLAGEGKLTKAGEYTRFIDETLTVKKKKDLEDRMRNIEKFIEGLKDLDAKGQFNASNIAKLLQPGQGVGSANKIATIQAFGNTPGTTQPRLNLRAPVFNLAQGLSVNEAPEIASQGTLRSEVRSEEAFYFGLKLMMDEMVSNAAKVTEPNKQMIVGINEADTSFEIIIDDGGPGWDIPQLKEVARAYDRLYDGFPEEDTDNYGFMEKLQFEGEENEFLAEGKMKTWVSVVREIVNDGREDWEIFHELLSHKPVTVGFTGRDIPGDADIPGPNFTLHLSRDGLNVEGGRGWFLSNYYAAKFQGTYQTFNRPEEGVGMRVRFWFPETAIIKQEDEPDEELHLLALFEKVVEQVSLQVESIAVGKGVSFKVNVNRSEVRSPGQNEVELKHERPGYQNDGSGKLSLTINQGEPVTIRLYSQYLEEPDLESLKGLLSTAKNQDEVNALIEKLRAAISQTQAGARVDLSGLTRSEVRSDAASSEQLEKEVTAKIEQKLEGLLAEQIFYFDDYSAPEVWQQLGDRIKSDADLMSQIDNLKLVKPDFHYQNTLTPMINAMVFHHRQGKYGDLNWEADIRAYAKDGKETSNMKLIDRVALVITTPENQRYSLEVPHMQQMDMTARKAVDLALIMNVVRPFNWAARKEDRQWAGRGGSYFDEENVYPRSVEQRNADMRQVFLDVQTKLVSAEGMQTSVSSLTPTTGSISDGEEKRSEVRAVSLSDYEKLAASKLQTAPFDMSMDDQNFEITVSGLVSGANDSVKLTKVSKGRGNLMGTDTFSVELRSNAAAQPVTASIAAGFTGDATLPFSAAIKLFVKLSALTEAGRIPAAIALIEKVNLMLQEAVPNNASPVLNLVIAELDNIDAPSNTDFKFLEVKKRSEVRNIENQTLNDVLRMSENLFDLAQNQGLNPNVGEGREILSVLGNLASFREEFILGDFDSEEQLLKVVLLQVQDLNGIRGGLESMTADDVTLLEEVSYFYESLANLKAAAARSEVRTWVIPVIFGTWALVAFFAPGYLIHAVIATAVLYFTMVRENLSRKEQRGESTGKSHRYNQSGDEHPPDTSSAETTKALADKFGPFLSATNLIDTYANSRPLGIRDNFIFVELFMVRSVADAAQAVEDLRNFPDENIASASGEAVIRWLYSQGALQFVVGSAVPAVGGAVQTAISPAGTVPSVLESETSVSSEPTPVESAVGRIGQAIKDSDHGFIFQDDPDQRKALIEGIHGDVGDVVFRDALIKMLEDNYGAKGREGLSAIMGILSWVHLEPLLDGHSELLDDKTKETLGRLVQQYSDRLHGLKRFLSGDPKIEAVKQGILDAKLTDPEQLGRYIENLVDAQSLRDPRIAEAIAEKLKVTFSERYEAQKSSILEPIAYEMLSELLLTIYLKIDGVKNWKEHPDFRSFVLFSNFTNAVKEYFKFDLSSVFNTAAAEYEIPRDGYITGYFASSIKDSGKIAAAITELVRRYDAKEFDLSAMLKQTRTDEIAAKKKKADEAVSTEAAQSLRDRESFKSGETRTVSITDADFKSVLTAAAENKERVLVVTNSGEEYLIGKSGLQIDGKEGPFFWGGAVNKFIATDTGSKYDPFYGKAIRFFFDTAPKVTGEYERRGEVAQDSEGRPYVAYETTRDWDSVREPFREQYLDRRFIVAVENVSHILVPAAASRSEVRQSTVKEITPEIITAVKNYLEGKTFETSFPGLSYATDKGVNVLDYIFERFVPEALLRYLTDYPDHKLTQLQIEEVVRTITANLSVEVATQSESGDTLYATVKFRVDHDRSSAVPGRLYQGDRYRLGSYYSRYKETMDPAALGVLNGMIASLGSREESVSDLSTPPRSGIISEDVFLQQAKALVTRYGGDFDYSSPKSLREFEEQIVRRLPEIKEADVDSILKYLTVESGYDTLRGAAGWKVKLKEVTSDEKIKRIKVLIDFAINMIEKTPALPDSDNRKTDITAHLKNAGLTFTYGLFTQALESFDAAERLASEIFSEASESSFSQQFQSLKVFLESLRKMVDAARPEINQMIRLSEEADAAKRAEEQNRARVESDKGISQEDQPATAEEIKAQTIAFVMNFSGIDAIFNGLAAVGYPQFEDNERRKIYRGSHTDVFLQNGDLGRFVKNVRRTIASDSDRYTDRDIARLGYEAAGRIDQAFLDFLASAAAESVARSEVRSESVLDDSDLIANETGEEATQVFAEKVLNRVQELKRIDASIEQFAKRLEGYMGPNSALSPVRMESLDKQITAIQNDIDSNELLEKTEKDDLHAQLNVQIERLEDLANEVAARKEDEQVLLALQQVQSPIVEVVAKDAVKMIVSGQGDPGQVSVRLELAGKEGLPTLLAALRKAAEDEMKRLQAEGLGQTAATFTPEMAEAAIDKLNPLLNLIQQLDPGLLSVVFNVPGDEAVFSDAIAHGLKQLLSKVYTASAVPQTIKGVSVIKVNDLEFFKGNPIDDNNGRRPVIGTLPTNHEGLFASESSGIYEGDPYKQMVDFYARTLFGLFVATKIVSAEELKTEVGRAKVLAALKDPKNLGAAEISELVASGIFTLSEDGRLVTNSDNLFASIVAEFQARSEVRKAA